MGVGGRVWKVEEMDIKTFNESKRYVTTEGVPRLFFRHGLTLSHRTRPASPPSPPRI
jgi:hypothetical protein